MLRLLPATCFSPAVLYAVLFACFFACGEAFGATSPPRPLRMDGVLDYRPLLQTLEGNVRYEVPPDVRKLEWILYPNRYLGDGSKPAATSSRPSKGASGAADRESVEAYSPALTSEDRDSVRQQGSLRILKAVEELYPDADCARVFLGGRVPAWSHDLTLTYNRLETIISHNVAQMRGSSASCHLVHFTFTTEPPLSDGNFGINASGDLHLSGPVFPVSRTHVHTGVVHFSDPNVTCLSCVPFRSGVDMGVSQLLLPFHVTPNGAPPVTLYSIEGVRVALYGPPDTTVDSSIESLMRAAIDSMPGPVSVLARSRDGLHVSLYKNLLVQNIVGRQNTEIQLGVGFLRINPFLIRYHEAAFMRAFVEALTLASLERATRPTLAGDVFRLTSVAKLLAQYQVPRAYKNLDEIKALSKKFDFFPFFNSILQGNALSNNEIFLGDTERPNPADTAPFDLLFPSPTGIELEKRIKWCLAEPTFKAFDETLNMYLQGDRDAKTFLAELTALPAPRCSKLWPRLLNAPLFPEHDGVRRQGNQFVFFRELNRDTDLAYFHDPADAVTDVFELNIKATKDPERKELWSETENVRRYSIAEDIDEHALIDGPNTDPSGDRRLLPRRIQFQLSSVKLGYESVTHLLTLEQGLQWNVLGEPTSRTFSLITTKELLGYFTTAVYGMNLAPYFCNPEQIRILGDTVCEPLGFKLPASIGYRQQFLAKRLDSFVTLSIGLEDTKGDILAPSGYSLGATVNQSITRQVKGPPLFFGSLSGRLYIPTGLLLTMVPQLTFGGGTQRQTIVDLTGAPVSDQSMTMTTTYLAEHAELRWAAFHDVKYDFFNSVLFETVVIYGGQHIVVDLKRPSNIPINASYTQWVTTGVRFFGSFFGAKNQAISLEIIRNLDLKPYTKFGFTLGRSS